MCPTPWYCFDKIQISLSWSEHFSDECCAGQECFWLTLIVIRQISEDYDYIPLAQVVVACYDKFRLQHATEWPHQASTTCILKGRFPKNGWPTLTAKFRTPKFSLRCLSRSFWLWPFRFWKWFVQLYWDGSYICLRNDLVFLTSEQMFQKCLTSHIILAQSEGLCDLHICDTKHEICVLTHK